MGKQVWQVVGTDQNGQRMMVTVSSSSRESAIATAAKNGVFGGEAVPVQESQSTPPLSPDELFPPVTIERISFGATLKIGIGVFVGGLLAAIATVIVLNAVGMLAR
jgi:hypothetical protein